MNMVFNTYGWVANIASGDVGTYLRGMRLLTDR